MHKRIWFQQEPDSSAAFLPPFSPNLVASRVARHHQLITSALFVAALIVVASFPSFDRRPRERAELRPGPAKAAPSPSPPSLRRTRPGF